MALFASVQGVHKCSSRFRRLGLPERLEVRAAPGGFLEILLGAPLCAPLLSPGSTDRGWPGGDELPQLGGRKQDRVAAARELPQDQAALDCVLGEVRSLLTIAGTDVAIQEAYLETARTRIGRVSAALEGSDGLEPGSRSLLADLWWVDELLGALARPGRGANGSSVEGGSLDVRPASVLDNNLPPVAYDDAYSTRHDQTLSISAPGVLSNDYDLNGDPLSASLVSGPSHAASFTLNANGSFSYTPVAHYAGPDGFVYRASDGQATDDASVSLNVTNYAPVVYNDSYSVRHDTTLAMSAPGVKSNDYDMDGDPTTAILLDGPAHAASFTFNANGSFEYIPALHYAGPDSFTYKLNDQIADSQTATVSISVTNYAPSVSNDSYSVRHDTTLAMSAPGVKSNDYDMDGDPTTAILVSGPTHAASFTFNADGSFEYVPALHYAGPDGFTYKLNDQVTDSAMATVSINVTNYAPYVSNDNYAIRHDTTLTVATPGVKSNDYDMDGDPTTAILLVGPTHAASFTFNADGSFEYVPALHYAGPDSFTYKLNDQVTNSATATASINVYNSAPVVENDGPYYIGFVDNGPAEPLVVGAPGVLGNDHDADGDYPLTAVLYAEPTAGASKLSVVQDR